MPKAELHNFICELSEEKWTPAELRMLPLERDNWYCVSEVDERGPVDSPSLFGWERWENGQPWGGEVGDDGRPMCDAAGRRGRWLPVRLVQVEIEEVSNG